MSKFIALIKKEYLELLRTQKLMILVIIMLFIALASPITAKLIPDILGNMELNGIVIKVPTPTWADAVDQFMKNLGQFGIIVIILLFSGSVADEKQKKMFEIVLTKPIRRASIISSKISVALITVITLFWGAVLIFIAYTNNLFEALPINRFIVLALFLTIFIAVIIIVTITVSVLSESYLSALGVMSFVYLVVLPLLSLVSKIKPYLPDYVLSQYKQVLSTGDFSVLLVSVKTSTVIVLAAVLLSLWTFQQQEVER